MSDNRFDTAFNRLVLDYLKEDDGAVWVPIRIKRVKTTELKALVEFSDGSVLNIPLSDLDQCFDHFINRPTEYDDQFEHFTHKAKLKLIWNHFHV